MNKFSNPFWRFVFSWCVVIFILIIHVILGGKINATEDTMNMLLIRCAIGAIALDFALLAITRWIQQEVKRFHDMERRY